MQTCFRRMPNNQNMAQFGVQCIVLECAKGDRVNTKHVDKYNYGVYACSFSNKTSYIFLSYFQ